MRPRAEIAAKAFVCAVGGVFGIALVWLTRDPVVIGAASAAAGVLPASAARLLR